VGGWDHGIEFGFDDPQQVLFDSFTIIWGDAVQ
jgi:hypothetical protein